LKEARAFAGELVEVRRLRIRMAVTREVAPPEIVGEKEDDVRPRRVGGEGGERQEKERGEERVHQGQ
jgi:hypothetical protein